jgi:ParB family chromosome partitioning protein
MKMALGRGLESLLPEKGDEVIQIDVNNILPLEGQPRKIFKDETLNELSASIKEKGILQPVIVSRLGDGKFRLIAGERRWRAARLAGLAKIPALIKEVTSQAALEIALIENIQREELKPVETAEALNRLYSEFNLSQDDISRKVGKDRSTIANYLRILKLPDEVKSLINDNNLTVGHAKAILSLEGKQGQIEAAKRIIKNAMSVRAAEALCKKMSTLRDALQKEKLPEVVDLEDRLIKALGTKVRIHHKGRKGKIEIEYYSLEELDRLLEIFLRG